MGLATLAVITLTAAIGIRFVSAPSAATHASFIDIALPSGVLDYTPSHDGRHLAYTIEGKDGAHLWIQALDAQGLKRVPGTDGAAAPFWSPDDQHVGFFVSPAFGGGGRIKRVNLATDAVETISDLPGVTGNIDIPSGAWNSSGDLIVTLQGIFHRPVSGGSLEPLVIPDLARGEAFLSFPQFLPDGQHYLFTAFGRDGDDKEAYVRYPRLQDAKVHPAGTVGSMVCRARLLALRACGNTVRAAV